jgi:hypothetical protein
MSFPLQFVFLGTGITHDDQSTSYSAGQWNSTSSCNTKISFQRAALKRLTEHYFKTKIMIF